MGHKKSTFQNGFTLIEIMLAVLILAFMATMTAMSIRQSIKMKTKLETELDDDSQLREVVALITRDLNLAFHWYDPQEIIKKKISDEAKAAGKPDPFPSPTQQQGPIITPDQITYFMGDRESMSFTTLSHERTLKDSQESEQAKVTYSLKNMRSYKDKNFTKTLVRSVDTFLDGDYKKTGKDTPLIENVTTFKLRYLPDDVTKEMGDLKEISDSEWLDSWKSEESEDAKTKGKFPLAVEVTLNVERNGRKSNIKTIIAIHNPNNEPFHFPQPAGTPPPGGAVQGNQGGG